MPLIVAGGEGRSQLRTTLTPRARSGDNSRMDNKPTKRGGGVVVALVLVVVLVVMPMLYVLSIGPAARLAWRGYYSISYYHAAYHPLYDFCNQCPVLDDALAWYVKLWLPLKPDLSAR